MSDIYLNYSHADVDAAHQLYTALTEANFRVWVDNGMEPGSAEWRQAARQALKESSCMVVLLSPNAARSEPVEEIVGFARISRKPIFSALVAGELRRATPLGLKVEQYVDLREMTADGISTLMANIMAVIEHLENEQAAKNKDDEDQGWREEDWEDEGDDDWEDEGGWYEDDYERDEY